ncbi:polyprenyl synthetase family protein [Gulosibacter macacae]|uniref:Polyprenyl synthetase family protein n=1 Tax=Gulosibacter macacae TaxID=2488791 RepID=A0A3P3W005_9MICO|nr:polyprenyl synthetase family protein [Gulosibacter macacae]RRJ86263.1 polyprenyl synthetase family protein [Gulosibacter macacae]
MPESLPLVNAVNERISALLTERRAMLEQLGIELAPVVDQLDAFTSGGKRSRARFLAAGAAQAIGTTDANTDDALATAVVDAAAALELFHAAALVHDDLLDRSDTRRGLPATHRVFEQLHADSGWVGDREHFGLSAAILAGDLLLMWSDDLFINATVAIDESSAARARAEYTRMRTEVTAGQFLDIVEELAWSVIPITEWADRAIAIATSKSARYSVEAPLVLGALLAGADDELIATIRSFGLPLGLAFQLRDDVLGVFGDSAVTGKPAGDDLREGKRTLIVAEVERLGDAETRAFFDARLGQPDLTNDEIARMQELIRATGALDEVEARIQAWLDECLAVLEATPLEPEVRELLIALAELSARRDA